MNAERITGKTRLLAVIGRPVAHSLSPRIHNHLAAALGLPYAYLAFDVCPEDAGRFADAARLMRIAGFNVTMPLKEHILLHLDEISEEARRYGAVNTVVLRDGRLIGHNTDGGGFLGSLAHAGYRTPDRALVLGAGGAAKAVSLALASAGCRVCIASRRKADFAYAAPGLSWSPWDAAARAAADCTLLVNATPLGMKRREPFADLSFLDALPAGALVYDLLYEPRETALLAAAKQRGLGVMNGIPHLVHQAVLSFALFTGVAPGENLVDKAIEIASFPCK